MKTATVAVSSAAAACLSAMHGVASEARAVAEAGLLALPAGARAVQGLLRALGEVAEQCAVAGGAMLAARSADSYRLLDAARLEMDAAVSSALSEAQRCLHRCQSLVAGGTGGGFEWTDGVVVRALLQGHWLLVDNVNLCSASVLDRLNSLLEPGGSLLLTEAGGARVVAPHADFRIFLCMDASHGEISRAMRNRCVELSLTRGVEEEDAAADIARGKTYCTRAGLGTGPEIHHDDLDAALLVVYRLMHGLSPSPGPNVSPNPTTTAMAKLAKAAKPHPNPTPTLRATCLPDHAHPARLMARLVACIRLETALGLGR